MRLSNRIWPSIKLLAAFCLCLLCPKMLSAQKAPDNSAPPEILILNFSKSFRTQRYLPHNWENLPESYPRRSYPGPGVVILPSTEAPMPRMKSRPLFTYTVEIKNAGAKKIAGVVWEYVFVSTADEKEVARLQFQSRAKVAANQSLTLIGKSLERPPLPRVVTAEKLEKEGDSPYRERVEIKCVLYADGTWGRHHKVLDSDCESLARGKQRKAN